MRETKFRAWNPEAKLLGGGIVLEDLIYYDLRSKASNLKEWEWTQYTGLKDKNGVEIYEGDILLEEYGFDSPREQRRYHVQWNEYQASFMLRRYGVSHPGKLGQYNGFMEVIGNIYENPELLGEQREV